MATVINNRSVLTTDPIRNFRFLVTFKPLDTNFKVFTNATLGFTSVGGLNVTTDSIPYREGGYNTTVHQIPGQTTFSPITLQRGVMINTSQNWDWMKTLFQTVQGTGTGSVGTNFRCDVEIQVLSHPIAGAGQADQNVGANATIATADHVAMRFQVYNAWITSVAYSDLNAGDNAIFVEQMTLVHEGFDLNWATSLPASGTTDAATGGAPDFTDPAAKSVSGAGGKTASTAV